VFVAGDARVNEHNEHFPREHNRLCDTMVKLNFTADQGLAIMKPERLFWWGSPLHCNIVIYVGMGLHFPAPECPRTRDFKGICKRAPLSMLLHGQVSARTGGVTDPQLSLKIAARQQLCMKCSAV
jgi:hypothetical protein